MGDEIFLNMKGTSGDKWTQTAKMNVLNRSNESIMNSGLFRRNVVRLKKVNGKGECRGSTVVHENNRKAPLQLHLKETE